MSGARIFPLLIFGACALFAQHEDQPIVDLGGQVFRANCVGCHGPDGDQVPDVDLGRGKFKRATSDNDLMQIIRNGIPNTSMPAHKLPEGQIKGVVAYLRSLQTAPGNEPLPGGNLAKGKAYFEVGGSCLTCHAVNGIGSHLGPDLSDIGKYRRVAELRESINNPNAEILPQHQMYRLVTQGNLIVVGRILNQDTFTLQMVDPSEHLLSYVKSELKELEMVPTSPMPAYKSKLTPQEMTDLLTYLVSLKGR